MFQLIFNSNLIDFIIVIQGTYDFSSLFRINKFVFQISVSKITLALFSKRSVSWMMSFDESASWDAGWRWEIGAVPSWRTNG